MRILFVSDAYVPVPSGVAVSMETLRLTLEKLGHKVFIIAPKYRGFKESRDFVGRLGGIFRSNEKYAPLIWPIKKPSRKSIRALKIDIVHSHFFYEPNPIANFIAKSADVPHISTFYKIFPEVAKLKKSRTAYEKSLIKTFRFGEGCDQIVALSLESKKYLHDKLGLSKPIDVLPVGIFVKDFTSFPAEAVKLKFKIPNERKIVLFVGSADDEGNLALLIKSFRRVWKAIDDVHLLIVGGGKRLEDFRHFVSIEPYNQFVTFTGYLPKNQVNRIFGAADILAYPSYLDPEPLVVLESMAAGTPVVAASGFGAQDFVKNEITGLISKPEIEDFSDKIIELLRRNQMRLEFSQNSRAHAREFRSSNLTQDLVELYTSTTENFGHKLYK